MTTPEELFSKSEFDKRREHVEFHETVRTADWLKGELHYGKNITLTQAPFPGLEFTHFPGEGRDGTEGHFAKRMGVRPGVDDFLFWWGLAGEGFEPIPCSGFIELKVQGKKPKKLQTEFDRRMKAMGFKYRAVCYTTEEVRDTLISWGIPYKHVSIPPRKPTKEETRNFALEMLRP